MQPCKSYTALATLSLEYPLPVLPYSNSLAVLPQAGHMLERLQQLPDMPTNLGQHKAHAGIAKTVASL